MWQIQVPRCKDAQNIRYLLPTLCNYYSIGSSALVGSLNDDTVVNAEALPDLQRCNSNIPYEKEESNATSVARGGGAGATRRRQRVSGGLGLMSAYSSQSNEPKFRCANYNCS